jgi:hypothetical protein
MAVVKASGLDRRPIVGAASIESRESRMPGVGPSELAVLLLIVGVYVAIGALILAVAVRVVGRRRDPQRVLRERLDRGEITRAEFEDALRILGER